MTIRGSLLLILAVLSLAACDKPASERAATLFEGDWIAFSHPGDWTVARQAQGERQQIRVAGPDGAQLDITIVPAEIGGDLEAFARGLPRDTADARLLLVDRPAHTGRLHGYRETLRLRGRQVQREYHQVTRNDETAYLVSEVAAAQALQAQPGFDLVFTTFRFK
jgi:hypothetical protein